MACFHPLHAHRGADGSIFFNRDSRRCSVPIFLPCGQCIGCRLDHSLMWATRCMHEAQLHDDNCFITLTYDDDHVPRDGSLVKSHFQKFMKRLRFRFSDRCIRFFHCGEYGDELSRPHYHAILFGFDFPDKELFSDREGVHLFTSKILSSLWIFGFSTVGSVTFESCAYVARYCVKKVNGDAAFDHYLRWDEDGVCYWLLPEYTTMSRRPGIAADWYRQFSGDVFPRDEVILRGKRVKPPRYYENFYEHDDPYGHAILKARRLVRADALRFDCTPERLRVREIVKESKFLPRTL